MAAGSFLLPFRSVVRIDSGRFHGVVSCRPVDMTETRIALRLNHVRRPSSGATKPTVSLRGQLAQPVGLVVTLDPIRSPYRKQEMSSGYFCCPEAHC